MARRIERDADGEDRLPWGIRPENRVGRLTPFNWRRRAVLRLEQGVKNYYRIMPGADQNENHLGGYLVQTETEPASSTPTPPVACATLLEALRCIHGTDYRPFPRTVRLIWPEGLPLSLEEVTLLHSADFRERFAPFAMGTTTAEAMAQYKARQDEGEEAVWKDPASFPLTPYQQGQLQRTRETVAECYAEQGRTGLWERLQARLVEVEAQWAWLQSDSPVPSACLQGRGAEPAEDRRAS